MPCENYRVEYACIQCHDETAGHAPAVWPKLAFHTKAVYCGNCQYAFSIASYLSCDNACPNCQAAFNPGCVNHHHFYFEQ